MASKEEPTKGYPLELFLEEIPDKYLCTLCGLVSQNIHIVNCCEKRFCLSCIEPRHTTHQPCPHCNDEEFDLMSLKKDNEKINNFTVRCREEGKGCQWTGKLKDLHGHLTREEDGCQYSLRECPKCHRSISRRELPHHQEEICPERDYQCKHCNYQGSYDHVMRAHMPDCTYCPVVCPNKCGVTCERANMDEHINEICPEQYLACEYEYAGCEKKYQRKNKDDHMTTYMNDHKLMAEVHKQVARVMKKYEEEHREETEAREKKREEMEREIHKLRDKVVQLEHQLEQLRQERPDHHYQHQQYQATSAAAEQYQATSAAAEHYNVSKKKPTKSPVVQQSNDYMYARLVDGAWMFTVNKFTERKDNQEKWESDIMKTPLGYKLQLNVWPNGQKEGEGSYVSVWLGYLSGVDDGRLPFPVQITMTLELHDHFGKWELLRTEKFILTGTYKYRFNYIGTFNDNKLILHERLHMRQFIQNDSIVMCITLIEERILDPSELQVDESLENYFDSELEGNFLEPYNPQQD